MARSLLRALSYGDMAAEVVSDLQTREPRGDTAEQARLRAAAADEVARLSAVGGWALWLTYHSYYKAPDLVGPCVAAKLGIPYVQVEATRAQKRLQGPWAGFAQSAEAASDAAATIFALTLRDAEALRAYAPTGQRIEILAPFLQREDLPPLGTRTGSMLSVGMLRHADKLASYRLIAETLAQLTTPDWRLEIAGDGPARADVAALMAPFGDRVRLRGALTADELAQAYASASLLVWPGVNEAFGMSYLEAQAAGVPVVAQDRPGVRDVLAPAARPPVEAGTAALAVQIDMLLQNETTRQRMGDEARAYVAKRHLLGTASDTLCRTLRQVAA